VGFDDSPLIAFTDPPLTTVRKPVQAMGQASVRALLEETGDSHSTAAAPERRRAPVHGEFVFMPELVVRGSTASARGRDTGRDGGGRP
jgi:DNA-binding LacI/PurR family transcriptional regulator